MLGFAKSSVKGDQVSIVSSGIYNVSDSTFMGFILTAAASNGACIRCEHSTAVLNVLTSAFLSNYAVDLGAAITIISCASVSFFNLCFLKNQASKSPDFYLYNKNGYLLLFSIKQVSLYNSRGVYYGLAVGSNSPSSMSNVNQSNCVFSQGNYGIFLFYLVYDSVEMNYIMSSSNQHVSIISSTSVSSNVQILIKNFCSAGDAVSQICNFVSSNNVIFQNSVFLFDKIVNLGSATYVSFDENCFSNIGISSISLKVDATQLQFIAEECWNLNLVPLMSIPALKLLITIFVSFYLGLINC